MKQIVQFAGLKAFVPDWGSPGIIPQMFYAVKWLQHKVMAVDK